MLTFRENENTITGVVNGKPFSLPRTPEVKKALIDLKESGACTYEIIAQMAVEARKIFIATKNKYVSYNPKFDSYHLTIDGKTSKLELPSSLVTYLEMSAEKDIDYMPVVKVFVRLMMNPYVNQAMVDNLNKYLETTFVDEEGVEKLIEEGLTRDQAISSCTFNDISITEEGLLATYKVAQEVDWKYVMEEDPNDKTKLIKVKKPLYEMSEEVLCPVTGEVLSEAVAEKPTCIEDYLFTPAIHKHGHFFYSGTNLGYVYQVGKVQRLPAQAPRNFENTFGGGGLYIGGLAYVEGYSSDRTKTLTCFVDPANIISFQSEGQAIRVNQLMPYNVLIESAELRGMYHSSEYAKMSEELLEESIKTIVDLTCGVNVTAKSFGELVTCISSEYTQAEWVSGWSDIIKKHYTEVKAQEEAEAKKKAMKEDGETFQ